MVKNAAKTRDLRLFVLDDGPKSRAVIASLESICRRYLDHDYRNRIADIHRHPEIAKKEPITAVPTLQKLMPEPHKARRGDFSVVANVPNGPGVKVTG